MKINRIIEVECLDGNPLCKAYLELQMEFPLKNSKLLYISLKLSGSTFAKLEQFLLHFLLNEENVKIIYLKGVNSNYFIINFVPFLHIR